MGAAIRTAKAAVARGQNQPLEITTIEVDPPGPAEVRVEVVATGICHSDLSVWNGTLRGEFPMLLGHEAAGIVEAIGEGVTNVKVGDTVIAALTPACGVCAPCRKDKAHLCVESIKTIGFGTMLDGKNRVRIGDTQLRQLGGVGSFADLIVMPAGSVVPIPKELPMDEVCLVGCGVTTGVGAALFTAKVERGSDAAIIGCGGVGLSIVQGARIAGAKTIVAVDPMPEKRALARRLGATHEVDPSAEDPVRAVRKLSPGGVDYAFEAVGRPELIRQTWGMLRAGGLAVVVGVPRVESEIPLVAGGFLQEKRITGSVYGSCLPRRDFPVFLDYYRKGELHLGDMIARRIPLEEVNEAFRLMEGAREARAVIVHRPELLARAG